MNCVIQIRASAISGSCYKTHTAAAKEEFQERCTSAAVRKQQVLKYGSTEGRRIEAEQTINSTKKKITAAQRQKKRGENSLLLILLLYP